MKHSIQTVQQSLICFFEQVAQKDIHQLKCLEQDHHFCLNGESWCFTLPDLHRFLQHQNDIFSSVEYSQFRQLLFNCPINQMTKQHGAHIIIHNNLFKVDQSQYALVWQEALHERT